MGELRGGYRVHFVVALVLCGADLLCMASTWLPGEYVVPRGLVIGLFIAVFPVFISALVRVVISGGFQQMGRGNGHRLVEYVRLLPPVMKLVYALVVGAAALGLSTAAGTAEDAQADASGYYYTYWDRSAQPQHLSRVELTRPEYYEVLKSQLRIFSAGPAVFHAAGSFLVAVAASAAAARTRRSAPGRPPGAARRPGRT
ncbi:hypothetical protein OG871_35525 [Kitasatospora sp. NBC_00374]|uniref:hypothetical protein n=1 Tax=Kitasatospora sp. NBC_00374 TaxID=2975964 RepID=UPI00324619DD